MGKIAKHHGRNDDYRKWGRDKDLVRKGQRLVINNSAHICDKNQIKTESHLIKKNQHDVGKTFSRILNLETI